MDPLKLTLVLAGTGADGTRVEADLIAAGMPLEMANRDTCIAMVTLADDANALQAKVVCIAEGATADEAVLAALRLGRTSDLKSALERLATAFDELATEYRG